MRRVAEPLYFGLILTQADPSLHKFIGTPAYFQENVTSDQILADFDGFAQIGHCQILKPTIYGGKVVSLSFKLFLGNSVIDMAEVLLTDGGTRPACIFDEFLH